jgi:hypothetical protein
MRTETAGTELGRARRTSAIAGHRTIAASLSLAVVLGTLSGALAITAGTTLGMDLRPTSLQIGFALAIALITLVTVGLAVQVGRTRTHLFVLTAALLSAGAAAIHFAVVDVHFAEWWAFGAFFVASGVAQLTWSLLIVRWPSRPLFWLGVAGNAAIVLLWIVTRTEGTLLGPTPHEPEPVGVADGVSTALEIAIVVLACLVALRGLPRRTTLTRLAWVTAAAALALTTLGLLSAMAAAPSVIPAVD